MLLNRFARAIGRTRRGLLSFTLSSSIHPSLSDGAAKFPSEQLRNVLAEISASESPGESEMLLPSIWSILNLFDGAGAMSQNQNNCILVEITAPDSPGSILLWPRGQIVLFSMARHIHQSAQRSIAHARSCTPAGHRPTTSCAQFVIVCIFISPALQLPHFHNSNFLSCPHPSHLAITAPSPSTACFILSTCSQFSSRYSRPHREQHTHVSQCCSC